MSFQAMTWAVEQKVPALQKLVLLMLANRTNSDTGCCIPRIKLLAEDCGMGETATKTAIRALESAGMLAVEERFRDSTQLSNQYRLLMPVRGSRDDGGGSPNDPGSVVTRPRGGRQAPTEPGTESGREPVNTAYAVSANSPAGEVPEKSRATYKVPACPTDELVSLYAAALPALPQVVAMSDTRRRALSARWREVCAQEKYDRAAGLEWFKWFFEHVGKSRFLVGGSAPNREGRSFRADFDWLLKPGNFLKVVEGRYHEGRN